MRSKTLPSCADHLLRVIHSSLTSANYQLPHELMMSTGVGRVAVVHSGQNFLKSQLSSLSKKWKLPVRSFTDRTEAESWLNQV
jgi:hypothetical protein